MITKSADKINISDNTTAFSHPSYYEAFEYAIDSEKKDSDRIRDILVKILVKLVNDNEALGDVAYTIANNYNSIPSNVQQLLFKLADNVKAARKLLFLSRGFGTRVFVPPVLFWLVLGLFVLIVTGNG